MKRKIRIKSRSGTRMVSRRKGKITNKEYRQLNPGITDRTVLNDFNELIDKGIIVAKGEKRYRYYTLR